MAKIYSFYKSVETDDYTFLSTNLTYLLYPAKKKKKESISALTQLSHCITPLSLFSSNNKRNLRKKYLHSLVAQRRNFQMQDPCIRVS